MAQRPLVCTFSAYSSTVPSGKLNLVHETDQIFSLIQSYEMAPYLHAYHLFWTTLVSSLILLPFSPSTFWVLVAMMMISVLVGVTRT